MASFGLCDHLRIAQFEWLNATTLSKSHLLFLACWLQSETCLCNFSSRIFLPFLSSAPYPPTIKIPLKQNNWSFCRTLCSYFHHVQRNLEKLRLEITSKVLKSEAGRQGRIVNSVTVGYCISNHHLILLYKLVTM